MDPVIGAKPDGIMLSAVDRRVRRETPVIAETFGQPADAQRQGDRSIVRGGWHRIGSIGGGQRPQPNPDPEAVPGGSSTLP